MGRRTCCPSCFSSKSHSDFDVDDLDFRLQQDSNMKSKTATSCPSNIIDVSNYKRIIKEFPAGVTYDEYTNEWRHVLWVPDCPKSRFDFLKSRKFPLTLVSNESEFRNYCVDKEYLITSKKWQDFRGLDIYTDNGLIETFWSKYNVKVVVSEMFWSDQHVMMMRAYALTGENSNFVNIALNLLSQSWKKELIIDDRQNKKIYGKVDSWLSTIKRFGPRSSFSSSPSASKKKLQSSQDIEE